jgi:hypothetical protein
VTWGLSFADPNRPKGTQFLGFAYVRADSFGDAVQATWRLGINPGGEVMGWEFPDTVPDRFRDRLLTRAEAEECDDLLLLSMSPSGPASA